MKPLLVNHIEIPVPNIAKAKKFYGEVFGWKEMMMDFSEDYVLVSSNKNPTQTSYGIYKVDEVPENKVMVTLGTENIEKTLELIEKAGGITVREKYEIAPDVGFAANFVDPFGNNWGLHSPPESK